MSQDKEREALLPCPFCGAEAAMGEVPDGHEDAGGRFVYCTNSACAASSALIFPLMDDVAALLLERWNRRAALASQQAVKGEPVAWKHSATGMLYDTEQEVPLADGDEYAVPLYASPPSREPLTDEQIRAEWLAAGGGVHGPNVETVTMPESRYFKFRRGIHSREGGSNEH